MYSYSLYKSKKLACLVSKFTPDQKSDSNVNSHVYIYIHVYISGIGWEEKFLHLIQTWKEISPTIQNLLTWLYFLCCNIKHL